MIHWYAILSMGVALIGAVLSLSVFAAKRGPNDLSILPALASAVLLTVQVVIMIVAPLTGNPPEGDLLEIWMYLIVALALPIGTGVWALVDKTKWANLVLAVMQFAVLIMTWRMLSLWFGTPSGF